LVILAPLQVPISQTGITQINIYQIDVCQNGPAEIRAYRRSVGKHYAGDVMVGKIDNV